MTSIKTRELLNLIEELNGDAASLSGDIDSLRDEIREKANELQEVHRIALEKMAELEEALREDFINNADEDDEDFDEDDFEVTDDDDYRSCEGLIEEIDGWLDEANN